MVVRRTGDRSGQSVAAEMRDSNADPDIDVSPLANRFELLPAAERTRLGAAGFRTFLGIGDVWSLTVSEPPRPILPLTSAERQRVEEALEALSALETAP